MKEISGPIPSSRTSLGVRDIYISYKGCKSPEEARRKQQEFFKKAAPKNSGYYRIKGSSQNTQAGRQEEKGLGIIAFNYQVEFFS